MDTFGPHFGIEPRLSVYLAGGAVAISSVILYNQHRITANNQELVFDGLPLWYTEQDVLTSRGGIDKLFFSVLEPTVTIKIAAENSRAVALQAPDATQRIATRQQNGSQLASAQKPTMPALTFLIVYLLLLLVVGMSTVLATLSHVVLTGKYRSIVLTATTKGEFATLPPQTRPIFNEYGVATKLTTPNRLTQEHNRKAEPNAPTPPSHGCSTLEALQFVEDFGGDDDDHDDWE